MPKNTIYDRLLERGYTDAEIREAADQRASDLNTRQFTLALADTPDGTPIVGIRYRCDYRAEEEWGIGELQKALGVPEGPEGWTMGGAKYANRVSKFTGLPDGAFGFVLSVSSVQPETVWGDHVLDASGNRSWPALQSGAALLRDREDLKDWQVSDNYDKWWESNVPWAQEYSTRASIGRYTTVKELKEIGAKLGIEKFKRSKADILAQIHAADSPLKPNIWPGWFHYGKQFVVRADSGMVADVLEMLHESTQVGMLSFGGGAGVFGSGLSLYDGRDVGVKLNRERKAYARWYKKAMKALEPVKAELKRKGHGWYFLGNPSSGFKSKVNATGDGAEKTDPKAIHYWLNGHGRGPGYTKQPSGWYTLKELRDEKFVADVNKREAARRK